MKNVCYLLCSLAIVAFTAFSCQTESLDDSVLAIEEINDETSQARKSDCVTIKSGLLLDSGGNPIETGYADSGYNYQARLYNGEYSPGWKLVMKWNDAWLSNKDCDGDGLLDRHLGLPSYIGSGAWLTNHWTTTYEDAEGNTCSYTEFLKIVAAPVGAYVDSGYWFNEDGTEIGEVIWGQFAIIQYVVNDPCEGVNGKQYNSPDHSGLGNW